MHLSNQREFSNVLNNKLVLYFAIFGNHSPYLNPIAYGPQPQFICSRSAIPSWSLCSERLRVVALLTIEKVMILAFLRLIGNLLQCLLPWLAPHVFGAALRQRLINICLQGSIIVCLLCWHDDGVVSGNDSLGQDIVHNQGSSRIWGSSLTLINAWRGNYSVYESGIVLCTKKP
jgi:hypothetical protein